MHNCMWKSWWPLLETSGLELGTLNCRWLRRDIVFRAGGYSGMTWDCGASEVEESLVWKLTLVRFGVISGGCGATEASGQTGSFGRLNGRHSVVWICVIILMRVNFWPLQQAFELQILKMLTKKKYSCDPRNCYPNEILRILIYILTLMVS